MELLKLLSQVFFLVFVIHLLSIVGEKEVQRVKVNYVRCNYSDDHVYNITCFAKSYSRNFSTLNIISTFKRPLNSTYVKVKLFYKYVTVYREVMHSPILNWCEMMEDKYENKMWEQLLQVIKDSAGPKLIHKCPYSEVEARNVSVNAESLISIFPTGDYKLFFYILNSDKTSQLAVINIGTSVLSSNKDNFG